MTKTMVVESTETCEVCPHEKSVGDIAVNKQDIQNFMKAYKNGAYPGQRLGQAFVNKFPDVCDHDKSRCLFYAPDDEARNFLRGMLKSCST